VESRTWQSVGDELIDHYEQVVGRSARVLDVAA
jgi:hypothetical protein